MKYWFRVSLLIMLAAAGMAAAPTAVVQATAVSRGANSIAAAREGTSIQIEIPQDLHVGAANLIRVTLLSSSGRPVADQTVTMKVNGVVDRRGRTSFNGVTDIIMRQVVDVGPVKIEVDFNGSSLFSASSAAIDAEMKPGTLEIPVVPAIEGVVLTLNGIPSTSGPDGVVRFTLEKAGDYQLAFPEQTGTETSQIAFHRWSDETFALERTITFPLKRIIQVGLDVSYRASIEFYDMDGAPVPPDRITSYTIKGSNGTPYTFTETGPHWLPASRVTRRAGGLEETQILYSVMDVQVDGSNVVTQAQQRFFIEPESLWKINLLFYSASFTAKDALFGFPLGAGVEVFYPDGRIDTIAFSEDNTAHITGLARGIYQLRVWKAPGFAPMTPMALSKNQEVDLLVVSYFDMIVVLSSGLLVAAGLILIGRPGILGFLKKDPGKTMPVAPHPSLPAANIRQVRTNRIRKDGSL